MKSVLGIFVGTLLPAVLLAAGAENCTPEKKTAVCSETAVKERVDWACKLVEKSGKDAVDEISLMRYDCCGEPNYVWINDMEPKMVMHPIKTQLNGQSLKDGKDSKDDDGKLLFVEFTKAATPSGAWVDYKWKKVGEPKGSPKRSWVRKCKVGKTADFWVVGSGTWK
jgi:signal transduction histidine kinase